LLFSLLWLLASVLGAPNSCSGACNVHDPAVIRRASDGLYFRFSTGNEIQIATASALSGPWTIKGSVLPSGSSINLAGNTDLWAPDVTNVGGTYYLYYSVSTFGSQASAIGLATSTSMDVGTWTDHGSSGVGSSSGSAYNAIDGSLVALSGGGYHLSFGSFWNDIYTVAMTNPPTAASGSSTHIAYNSSGTHAVEGSYTFFRSPYYYLFFSSGQCCGLDTSPPAQGDEYRINVCRSESVTGPYVDKNGVSCLSGGGTTVLASSGTTYAPGGQGVFADTNSGGTILYYHYSNTNIGVSDADTLFGWNVLNWSGGWPSV